MYTKRKADKVYKIFADHYTYLYHRLHRAKEVITDRCFYEELELSAVMCAVSYYAFTTKHADALRYTKPIMAYLSSFNLLDDNVDADAWEERADFYNSVLHGKEVHGYYMVNPNSTVLAKTVAGRCSIAFCDCILNHDYMFDYENVTREEYDSRQKHDIMEKMLLPFADQLNDLIKEMRKAV